MTTDDRRLPLLGIRRRVLFPGSLLRLTIGRPKSVRLVESLWNPHTKSAKRDATIAVCTVVRNKEGGGGSDDLPKVHEESKEEDDHATTTLEAEATATSAADAFPLGELEVVRGADAMVYAFGCEARIVQLSKVNSSDMRTYHFTMLVEGVARLKVQSVDASSGDFANAIVERFEDSDSDSPPELEALASSLRSNAKELLDMRRSKERDAKAKEVLDAVDRASPLRLADTLAANLEASVVEKQHVLCAVDVQRRLNLVLALVARQKHVIELTEKINSRVDSTLKNNQREYYLRQQRKAIDDELRSISGGGGSGEDSQELDEIELLEKALDEANLPEEPRQAADKELARLKNIQPAQPEHAVIRTYLEWLASLPWDSSSPETYDVEGARKVLDDDHFGLSKVKRRIVEYLSVRSLKKDSRGPILCLVGPPGVGKTSLGKSVAASLNREFRRIALGGVRDEAEIRGHRRTYIGALPGNIISNLKRAGTNNPVFLLDEIDKLGRDARGDPSSALLEVLDPEQNGTFTDHYLNVPFDLSKVLFLATANDLSTIPAPLLDRMEVINVDGYASHEKAVIAERHLVPKQMKRHGITNEHVIFTQKGIAAIMEGYTRESGVRNLDREIAAMCRSVAVKVASSRDLLDSEETKESLGEAGVPNVTVNDPEPVDLIPLRLHSSFEKVVVDPEYVLKVLGPVKYESEVAARVAVPGVATGLAWTRVGGEILFLEVSLTRGDGKIQLTGKLGDVMRESVRTALSFVRANFETLGLLDHDEYFEEDLQFALRRADIHVHAPAGAVPKDGPSAGVAFTAALVSALGGRPMRPDTACTGEVTLRGLVLPVGGIKEKVLAAHRAGIRRVVLPERNQKDAAEIPEAVKNDMEILFVSNVVDAIPLLFDLTSRPPAPAWRVDLRRAKRAREKYGDGGVEDRAGPVLNSLL